MMHLLPDLCYPVPIPVRTDFRVTVSEREAHEGVQKLGMGPFPDGAPGTAVHQVCDARALTR